jgi:hypothetical protein
MQHQKHGLSEWLLLVMGDLPIRPLRDGFGKEWMNTRFTRKRGRREKVKSFLPK